MHTWHFVKGRVGRGGTDEEGWMRFEVSCEGVVVVVVVVWYIFM